MMDREMLEKKIETVFARQKNLSPEVEQTVREKLQGLDWEAFVNKVLERFHAEAGDRGEDLSNDQSNQLLMDAIKKELDSTLG